MAEHDQSADSARAGGARRNALRHRAVEEARRFLVMFLYIWLWFALFQVYQRMLLRESGIGAASQGFALFNALVLAKVMLVAEDLKIGRWWRSRPLIYPILTESLAFSVVFILFHIVEHVVVGVISGETVRASVPVIGGGGLAGLCSVAMLYFVALIPFFAFRNVGREIGERRLNRMLFGSAAAAAADRDPTLPAN
jgi:hypothetical protein